jgi:hypothetical protein
MGAQSIQYDVLEGHVGSLVHKDAASAPYCHVVAAHENALYGYLQISVLENQCVQGLFCTKQQVRIHTDLTCQQPVQSLPLTGTHSTHLGLLHLSFGPFVNASNKVQWTTEVPASGLIPNFRKPIDILTVCSILFLLLCALWSLWMHTMRYRAKPNIVTRNNMIGQIAILSYLAMFLTYLYIYIETNEQVAIWGQILNTVRSIATLFVVVPTTSVILQVTGCRLGWQVAAYSAILVLHIGLMGHRYLMYWRVMETPKEWVPALSEWGAATQYWYIFLFVYSFVPIGILLYKLLRDEDHSITKRLLRLVHQDKKWTWIVMGVLMNIMSYSILSNILDWRVESLGSERHVLALISLKECSLACHCVLYSLMLDHIGVVHSNRDALRTVVKLTPLLPSPLPDPVISQTVRMQ